MFDRLPMSRLSCLVFFFQQVLVNFFSACDRKSYLQNNVFVPKEFEFQLREPCSTCSALVHNARSLTVSLLSDVDSKNVYSTATDFASSVLFVDV